MKTLKFAFGALSLFFLAACTPVEPVETVETMDDEVMTTELEEVDKEYETSVETYIGFKDLTMRVPAGYTVKEDDFRITIFGENGNVILEKVPGPMGFGGDIAYENKLIEVEIEEGIVEENPQGVNTIFHVDDGNEIGNIFNTFYAKGKKSGMHSVMLVYFNEEGLQEVLDLAKTIRVVDTTWSENDGTFEGNGYSFEYPEKYLENGDGLWKQDQWDLHYKNTVNDQPCSVCHIPNVNVVSRVSDKSLDEDILEYFYLPENMEEWLADKPDWLYENYQFGDWDVVRFFHSEYMSQTGFFVKEGNRMVALIVGGKVEPEESLTNIVAADFNDELKGMISSLRFN